MEDVTKQEGLDVTQTTGTDPEDNQIQLPKTPEELQALLQREADRRVNQAQKKWQEKQKEIVEAEKAEAARLAKMSAAEREKAQYEKERAEFEAEKAKLQQERLVSQVEKELVTKGLDANFAKYVIADTEEDILNNINNLKNLFDKAVNEAIKEKIATPAPKRGTSSASTGKSSFMEAISSKRVRK